MNIYDYLIVRLINNNHDKQDAEETAEKLVSYGVQVIPSILEHFNLAGPSGKCGMLETLRHFDHPTILPFLKKVSNDKKEIFFVRSYAEGVLEKLQLKQERLDRKIKSVQKRLNEKLNSIEVSNVVSEIAAIGVLGDKSILKYFDQLNTSLPRVKDQIEVAKLQIAKGIASIIKEYRNHDTEFNKDSLMESIYHTYDSPDPSDRSRAVDVILEDLFSSEYNQLYNALLVLCDNNFPKEFVKTQTKNRLFEILEGNYRMDCRDYAADALGNILSSNDKEFLQKLENFLKEERYRSKNRLMFWKRLDENYLAEKVEKAIKKVQRKINTSVTLTEMSRKKWEK